MLLLRSGLPEAASIFFALRPMNVSVEFTGGQISVPHGEHIFPTPECVQHREYSNRGTNSTAQSPAGDILCPIVS